MERFSLRGRMSDFARSLERQADGSGGFSSFRGRSPWLGCRSETENRIGLGAFLPLDDIELHVVAFFQAFISVELNCRVVDEDIRAVVSPDKSIAFCVIEPLHFAFVSCHRS